MEEEGIVKKVDGNMAQVAFVKKGGCGSGCSSCKSGCAKDTIIIDLSNTLSANVGERVLVSMDNKTFSNMTFWAYAFPTILTVTTLVICLYGLNALNITNYEVYSILLALAAMTISYKLGGKLNKNKNKYTFKMVRILK